MICMDGGNGNVKCWSTNESKYRGKNPRFYRQGGGDKKMFWRCFTASGPGLLIPIEGMMNAVSYVAMLREHVLPWIQQQEALNGVKLIFQQDNAPPHKALVTRQFFAESEIEVMDWPATSPDLNPIENLWSLLKRKIGNSKRPTSIPDMVRLASGIWESFTPDLCSRLALSLSNRMQEVKKANGGNTSY